MVSDRDRHDLYVALRERLGPGPADTMMQMLPPSGWADVATKADIDRLDAARKADIDRLDAARKADMQVIDADINRLDAARKADMQGTEAWFEKIDARFERLEAKIDRQFARMVYANVVSMVGIAGVVLGAGAVV